MGTDLAAGNVFPSGPNTTRSTGLPSARVAVWRLVATSHNLTSPSSSPAASVRPSGLKATLTNHGQFCHKVAVRRLVATFHNPTSPS